MSQAQQILDLFLAHRGELLNYANRFVRDAGHAEDVVQEAYLRFDAAATEQRLDEPVGYLYRIVRNLAVDWHRRTAREERHTAAGDEGAIAQIAHDRPSPEAAAAGKDEIKVILAAMAELPERTRTALEMHRFRDMKLKDIAARLDISIGLAHRLVAEGLEHCRERLRRAS